MNFFPLLFFLLIFVSHSYAVKIFGGVFFKELRHGIAYQSSVPLTYEVDFPALQGDILQAGSVLWPTCRQADCSLPEAVTLLFNSTDSILMSTERSFNASVRVGPQLSRKTRAIDVIGDFLHFCCSVATDGELHKLEFNEQKVTDHLNAFKGLVSDDHKDLIRITRNLRQFAGNFSHQFHEAYANLTDNMRRLVQENQFQEETFIVNQLLLYIFHLYSHVNILSRQEFIKSAKEHCDKKLLSSSLVQPLLLQADLYRLEKGYKTKGYQLAIPSSEMRRYFELPLTTCIVKDNSIVLSVKVPLRSTEGQYQLYQYVRTPMYFDGKTCHLQQQDFVLARRQGDGAIQVVSGSHLASCRPQTDFLCYLPRHIKDSSFSLKCMEHILTSEELTDIRSICELNCSAAEEEMEIVEYSSTEYIVSNIPENATVVCEDGSSHGLQRIPGAMFVTLPCHCALMVGRRVMVRQTFPCNSKSSKTPDIQHYLPLHWVKFNSLKIDVLRPQLNPKFSNFSEILKESIDINVPELNIHDVISSDIFEKVELPNSWGDVVNSTSFVFYILFGWLGLLTLFCVYLGIKLYVYKLTAVTVEQPKIRIIDS